MLLQVGAGFGAGFGVIVLWGHNTMMLVWCVLSVFLFLVLFFILCGRGCIIVFLRL